MEYAELKSKLVLDNILQDAAADLTHGYLSYSGGPTGPEDLQSLYWSVVNKIRSSGVVGELGDRDDIDLFKRTAKLCSGIFSGHPTGPTRLAENEGLNNGIDYFLTLFSGMKKSFEEDRQVTFPEFYQIMDDLAGDQKPNSV